MARGGSWGNPRTTTTAWKQIRRVVLDRDAGICHICHMPGAQQVDHVNGDHNDNRLSNLAAIHDNPCHRHKSSMEGVAAKALMAQGKTRKTPAHPGIVHATTMHGHATTSAVDHHAP